MCFFHGDDDDDDDVMFVDDVNVDDDNAQLSIWITIHSWPF